MDVAPTTAFIIIDDEGLSTQQWTRFHSDITAAVVDVATAILCRNYSQPVTLTAQMTIGFDVPIEDAEALKDTLTSVATKYGKTHVIWADITHITRLLTEHHPALVVLHNPAERVRKARPKKQPV